MEKGRQVKVPVVRSFSLPNGEKIVSLRESTFRAAVKAAGTALRAEHSKSSGGPKLKPG
jgi:hypothetical protein